MKKMIIFEPAMCCSTGVCGPSVDKDLLRVSTVINNLKNNGIFVPRYNLASNPEMFVINREINKLLNSEGVELLPVTMVDGKIAKIKAYPTDDEFCNFLEVSEKYLKGTVAQTAKGCGSNCG